MGKYLIIPDMERLEESICLAKEYDLGFEVNDFFEPNLQKEPERKEILIQRYTECERREPFTMHGCFHDVLIFSEDDEIRQEKCITIAFVGDERICDGYYYAASFKQLSKYLRKPELLESTVKNKENATI
mgnify:CR=1 FL=1